ncbi:hypothetical protein GRJ2_003092900 [Grus japonensis]|uniref:Uncharacterized protein n=1 Tax=Grus japonensis TaxID=30415 RepID=A0ABC9Y883_GRUJA
MLSTTTLGSFPSPGEKRGTPITEGGTPFCCYLCCSRAEFLSFKSHQPTLVRCLYWIKNKPLISRRPFLWEPTTLHQTTS